MVICGDRGGELVCEFDLDTAIWGGRIGLGHGSGVCINKSMCRAGDSSQRHSQHPGDRLAHILADADPQFNQYPHEFETWNADLEQVVRQLKLGTCCN